MAEVAAEEPGSQSERAYRALRELIRGMSSPPGSILSENALTERLRVGRTPLREAVSRLVHEGLLVRLPQRGLLINTLSAEDIRELYEVREALEVMCARSAAIRVSEGDLDGFRVLLEESRRAIDAGIDWLKYRELDHQFHTALARVGGNRRARMMLDSMFDAAVLDPWFGKISAIPGQLHRSVLEHSAIVEGLAARDPDVAAAAVRAHAQSYRRALADHLFGSA